MYIFPYKSKRKQIWPCRKNIKVHPRSSFEQILLGPSPQCCIPSPKVIGPLVPEKKIFKWFLPYIYIYMGVAAILVMWPRPWTNFRSPIPLRLHMKFGFDWPSGFGEEDVWKWWTTTDRWTDNGACLYYRLMDNGACLYYKLTHKPNRSGELKTRVFPAKSRKFWKLF